MEEWHLTKSDLKKYSHFDQLISAEEGEAYATDKDRVARHPFFPSFSIPSTGLGLPRKAKQDSSKKDRFDTPRVVIHTFFRVTDMACHNGTKQSSRASTSTRAFWPIGAFLRLTGTEANVIFISRLTHFQRSEASATAAQSHSISAAILNP
jgi:hypothetical protein